jgi:hypothetical protein
VGARGPEQRLDVAQLAEDQGTLLGRSSSDQAVQPGSSVSTSSNPRRASAASALDLPTPDMPVTSTCRTRNPRGAGTARFEEEKVRVMSRR